MCDSGAAGAGLDELITIDVSSAYPERDSTGFKLGLNTFSFEPCFRPPGNSYNLRLDFAH